MNSVVSELLSRLDDVQAVCFTPVRVDPLLKLKEYAAEVEALLQQMDGDVPLTTELDTLKESVERVGG